MRFVFTQKKPVTFTKAECVLCVCVCLDATVFYVSGVVVVGVSRCGRIQL